jgi:hypothetical protein
VAICADFDSKIVGWDERLYRLVRPRWPSGGERDSYSCPASFDRGVGSLARSARADMDWAGLWIVGANAYSNRTSGVSYCFRCLVHANCSRHSLQHARRLAD